MNIFTFGKYKGQDVNAIIASNPKYVKWCLKNIPYFSLNEEQKERLERHSRHILRETFPDNCDVNWEEPWNGYESDMAACFDPNY